MQVDALNNAMAAAERFLETAKAVEIESFDSGRKFVKVPSPKNSACKRASLDLTRALADLRRP